MCVTIRNLWKDERGFIISAEMVTIATLVVCGVIVGFSTVRDAVVNELNDLANALNSLNQSYSFTSFQHSSGGKILATCAGSSFTDTQTTSTVNIQGIDIGAGGGGTFAAGSQGFAAGSAGTASRTQEVDIEGFEARDAARAEARAKAEAKAESEDAKEQDAEQQDATVQSGICQQAGPMFTDPNSALLAPGSTIIQDSTGVMNGSGAIAGSGIYSGGVAGAGIYSGGVTVAPQAVVPQTVLPQTMVPQMVVPQTFVPEVYVPVAPAAQPFGQVYPAMPYYGPTINYPLEGGYCY